MAKANQRDSQREIDALLTDHFAYTPLSLIDDIINAVNQIVYHALDALEDGLLAVPSAQLGFGRQAGQTSRQSPCDEGEESIAAKTEIENGVHALETLLESTVDKNFDKFEIWTLRNILSVPPGLVSYVKLAHYHELKLPDSTSPTPESVLQLRRKVAETRKLNVWLKATCRTNQDLISRLRDVITPSPQKVSPAQIESLNLAFLQGHASSRTTSLQDQARMIISHLPTLKKLATELKPTLDALKTFDADKRSRREERRQYIEHGVRKIVNAHGLSSGEIGDTSTKELAEVQSLERLVGQGNSDASRRGNG